jgi:transposase InsO family protein
VFVIDLASRRVEIVGSTPHPNELFMQQVVRLVTAADDGILVNHRVLICDRDSKWSRAVRRRFGEAGLRVVVTPERAPNANAYAEHFVRSIKEECLHQLIPLGEWHFRRAVAEYVEHYHLERNHQGLDNQLIAGTPETAAASRVRRRSRLGGLLNYYERAA